MSESDVLNLDTVVSGGNIKPKAKRDKNVGFSNADTLEQIYNDLKSKYTFDDYINDLQQGSRLPRNILEKRFGGEYEKQVRRQVEPNFGRKPSTLAPTRYNAVEDFNSGKPSSLHDDFIYMNGHVVPRASEGILYPKTKPSLFRFDPKKILPIPEGMVAAPAELTRSTGTTLDQEKQQLANIFNSNIEQSFAPNNRNPWFAPNAEQDLVLDVLERPREAFEYPPDLNLCKLIFDQLISGNGNIGINCPFSPLFAAYVMIEKSYRLLSSTRSITIKDETEVTDQLVKTLFDGSSSKVKFDNAVSTRDMMSVFYDMTAMNKEAAFRSVVKQYVPARRQTTSKVLIVATTTEMGTDLKSFYRSMGQEIFNKIFVLRPGGVYDPNDDELYNEVISGQNFSGNIVGNPSIFPMPDRDEDDFDDEGLVTPMKVKPMPEGLELQINEAIIKDTRSDAEKVEDKRIFDSLGCRFAFFNFHEVLKQEVRKSGMVYRDSIDYKEYLDRSKKLAKTDKKAAQNERIEFKEQVNDIIFLSGKLYGRYNDSTSRKKEFFLINKIDYSSDVPINKFDLDISYTNRRLEDRMEKVIKSNNLEIGYPIFKEDADNTAQTPKQYFRLSQIPYPEPIKFLSSLPISYAEKDGKAPTIAAALNAIIDQTIHDNSSAIAPNYEFIKTWVDFRKKYSRDVINAFASLKGTKVSATPIKIKAYIIPNEDYRSRNANDQEKEMLEDMMRMEDEEMERREKEKQRKPAKPTRRRVDFADGGEGTSADLNVGETPAEDDDDERSKIADLIKGDGFKNNVYSLPETLSELLNDMPGLISSTTGSGFENELNKVSTHIKPHFYKPGIYHQKKYGSGFHADNYGMIHGGKLSDIGEKFNPSSMEKLSQGTLIKGYNSFLYKFIL